MWRMWTSSADVCEPKTTRSRPHPTVRHESTASKRGRHSAHRTTRRSAGPTDAPTNPPALRTVTKISRDSKKRKQKKGLDRDLDRRFFSFFKKKLLFCIDSWVVCLNWSRSQYWSVAVVDFCLLFCFVFFLKKNLLCLILVVCLAVCCSIRDLCFTYNFGINLW